MDDFIDDVMTHGCMEKYWKFLAGALMLSLLMFSLPLDPDQPIPGDDFVKISKLLSEGAPMET